MSEEWAKDPCAYLVATHNAIVSRFEEMLRYVTLHCDNSRTFSYEFASILRDACSLFGSFSGAVLKASDVKKVWERNP